MKPLVAAEELSKQMQEIEREIEKTKIEIAFRERGRRKGHWTDKLLPSERMISELPFDEQRDLLRHL